jgi:hypothetical protein
VTADPWAPPDPEDAENERPDDADDVLAEIHAKTGSPLALTGSRASDGGHPAAPTDDRPGAAMADHGAPALGRRYLRSDLVDLPKVADLVTGVMSTPAAVLVVGAYGLGKTVFVDGVGFSVSTGIDWLGRTVQRRRVLAIIGEDVPGRHARLAAQEQAWNHGIPISDDDLVTLVKPNSLANGNTWQQLTDYAVAEDFGLVTLDTFSSLAPDADEVKDAPMTMRRLSDLAAAINGTAALVHHPGWGPKNRARGGYQLEANADEVLILTGFEQSSLVSLTRKKVKNGESGGVIWLNRRPFAGSIILEGARAADAEVPIRERIIAALDAIADIGATGPQLMDDCGVDPKAGRSAFYKALRKLADDDLVTADGPQRTKRYWLTTHAPRSPE